MSREIRDSVRAVLEKRGAGRGDEADPLALLQALRELGCFSIHELGSAQGAEVEWNARERASLLGDLCFETGRYDPGLSVAILANVAGRAALGSGNPIASDDPICFPFFTRAGGITGRLQRDGQVLISGSFPICGAGDRYVVCPVGIEAGLALALIDVTDRQAKTIEPLSLFGLSSARPREVRLEDYSAMLLKTESASSVMTEAGYDLWRAEVDFGFLATLQGILDRSVSIAHEYACKRMQGGRPIIQWSLIRMTLARMASFRDCGQALLERARAVFAAGEEGLVPLLQAAILQNAEGVLFNTDRAIQVLGGNGYIQEYPAEKLYRDARALLCYEGGLEGRQLAFFEHAGLTIPGPKG